MTVLNDWQETNVYSVVVSIYELTSLTFRQNKDGNQDMGDEVKINI